VDPDAKFVPVKVRIAVVPLVVIAGVTDASVGTGGLWAATVNGNGALVPPSVVTVTSRGPNAASGAIVKVTTSALSLAALTLLTVTPAPLTKTVCTTNPQCNYLAGQ